MARYMIAKYTFNNSVADCLPTITGATTSQWSYSDEVDGTTTTRTIGTDMENLKITKYSFSGSSSLLTVEYLKIDEKITSMSDMFNGCNSLTTINTLNWDTQNVTTTVNMFKNCSSLISLDLSSFNTEKVTNLAYMFQNCSSLISLDLSSFNTEKVTSMGATFYSCKSLAVLDLSNWNTISTTSTSNMFNGSTKLTDIGLLYSSEATINKIAGILPNNPKNIFYYDADPSQLTPVEGVTFKKYRTPTTIQLPPHIQLHSLPDGTKDEVDLETGILTRNVGEIVWNGDIVKWNTARSFKVGDGHSQLSSISDWGTPNYNTLKTDYSMPENLTATNCLSENATMSRTFNGGLSFWGGTWHR